MNRATHLCILHQVDEACAIIVVVVIQLNRRFHYRDDARFASKNLKTSKGTKETPSRAYSNPVRHLQSMYLVGQHTAAFYTNRVMPNRLRERQQADHYVDRTDSWQRVAIAKSN